MTKLEAQELQEIGKTPEQLAEQLAKALNGPMHQTGGKATAFDPAEMDALTSISDPDPLREAEQDRKIDRQNRLRRKRSDAGVPRKKAEAPPPAPLTVTLSARLTQAEAEEIGGLAEAIYQANARERIALDEWQERVDDTSKAKGAFKAYLDSLTARTGQANDPRGQ